jgi:Zn-dependent M28 family amino/carboxypeptidase
VTDLLAQSLRAHVEHLAGEIGERNVWRPSALHTAEAFIGDAWVRLGYHVVRQAYVAQGVESANLEITIRGRERPSSIVLAGAHYDTVPGSPGADDNASGVAALIELARLLRDVRTKQTIRLVAFVNEEPPFFSFGNMGSQVYARAARARGDDIRIMFSLEMLGSYSDERGSQTYPPLLQHFYPDSGNFIAFVSNLRSRSALRAAVRAFKARADFPLERLASPSFVPGVSWSDHLSFWREGYRAVMVTDTAFYRYPHYHRATDTPEKLGYEPMAQVVAGLGQMLTVLAG